MTRIRLWLLAVGLAAGGILQARAGVAESPRLRIVGVEDGLPASDVRGLALDRAGYVWIATSDGLARYDGVGVRVWRHEPGRRSSLPGNYVAVVHVDDDDRVWVATEGRGLSVLDARRERFRHYRRAEDPRIGSDDTWAIANQGRDLWFGTFGGGLHRLGRDGRITRFMPVEGDPRSLPSDTVLTLAVDSRGSLWVGTTAGLARWTGRDFERMPIPGAEPDATVFSVTADADAGAVWVGASSGVHRLGADGKWITPSWSTMFAYPNAVFGFVPDGRRLFWLASHRHLWRGALDEVPHPVPIGTHGPPRPMLQLLRQPGGGLWLPVSGAGLGYLRPDWQRLSQHSRSEGGLSAELYRAAAPARSGGVWLVGMRGELERLALDGSVHPVPPKVRQRLDRRRLISLLEDRGARLWLGERDALLRVDPDGAVHEWRIDSARDAILAGQVDLFAEAPDGTVWLSCSGAGLQQRDATSGRVLATVPPGPSHGLGTGDLEAMAFDPAGRLWIAGEEGVSAWDPRTGRFDPVPGTPRGDRVFALAFHGRDEVWLQRLVGLEHYRRDGTGWRRVAGATVSDGIPAVEGSGLAVDAAGRVWLASPRGLFRWDPARRTVRSFGLGDGLSSQEFVDRGLALAAGGVLHAALADGGVVQLDTTAPDPAPRRPQLHLDRVETRREGRWEPLGAGAPVLAPGDRELRVQLRLLAFENPRANRYFSRLDGYDRNWIAHSGSDPGERVFANLPPGRYTLHARAVDAAGNAAIERRLQLTVQPPWWRSIPALAAFAALAVVASGGGLAAWRARQRRHRAWLRAEQEREVAHQASLAKTRFLATLGHEVRTPMTGVLGMSELLLETPLAPRQRDYAAAIRSAGEHLLRIVNDALDLACIEAGRLELADEAFDVRELVDDVAALMAPLAHRHGLDFLFDVAATVPAGLRGDPSRVRQILLNLLGNAIKFTERGQVSLQVHALPGAVRFSIADTGPGLGAEQRERLFRRFEQGHGARTASRYGGSGLGLAICQELAAAMGGHIGVDSAPGQGTRFDVDLPLMAAEPAARERSGPAASASLRVLLVEDDPTVAEVLIGLLQGQGHAVSHAGHGLAALAELSTTTFGVAVLDLDLPGLDGISLARQLRALGFTLPLVALTARADAEAESESLAAGFDRFMRKPVTGAMLAALLQETCSHATA